MHAFFSNLFTFSFEWNLVYGNIARFSAGSMPMVRTGERKKEKIDILKPMLVASG